jgi:succinate-acetate transporter protein
MEAQPMARAFDDTPVRTPDPPASLIADPAPLGLAGFGISTLLLSLINAGILGSTKGGDALKLGVMAVALTFGGLAQFVAGMWAFRRGNTFAATAFTSYGAFWFSFYLLVFVFIPQMKGATTADVTTFVGTYLLAWGIFTTYMFLASLAGARAVQAVFILLAITFYLLAIGFYQAPSDTFIKAGGWFGLATAAAALYASFADVTNANFKRRILPT